MLPLGRSWPAIRPNSSSSACSRQRRRSTRPRRSTRRPPPKHRPARRPLRMPTHMPRPPTQLLIVIIDLAGGTGTFCRTLATGLKKFFPGEFEISLLILRGAASADDNEFFHHIHTINSDVHRDWRRWIESPT